MKKFIFYKSNDNYTRKASELIALQDFISKNRMTVNDFHATLKIVLTLPVIEKFQGDNLPDSKKYKEFIKEQERIIAGIKKLIPEY